MKALRGQNAGMTRWLGVVAKPICVIFGLLALFSGAASATPNITGFLVNGVVSSTGPVGASLTIQGSGFGTTQGFSTATLNGIAVAGNGVKPTSWSDTSIVVTIPNTATSGPVIVKVSGVSSNSVTFNIGALISSISATTAPVGNTITITGAGFGTAGGTVTFGGATATTSSWTATSIQAQVPNAATAGPIIVSVGGQASNGMAFTPAPVITSISPGSGVGGTALTITGTGLGSSQGSVTFNSTPATIQSWGLNSITVLVPSNGTGGANNVVVTVNGISSTAVSFTVIPQITSVSPGSGVTGSLVTISGSNFGATQGSNAIAIGGIAATPSSWSSTNIVVPVPGGVASGAAPIVITVGGQATNFAFTVTPGISSISPTSGVVGTSVTIIGTSFGAPQGTSTVTFNGIAGTPTSWSDTRIVVPVPGGIASGSASIVITVGGQTTNFAFTVTPGISSISPTLGAVGTSVTITGTSFGATQGTSTVTFNGVTATPTNWTASSIVVPVPSNASSGNVVVTISNLASNGVSFNVTPAITSLSPSSAGAGSTVTITGTSFGTTQETSTVTFNGIAGTPSSWSNSSIMVPVPAGSHTGNVLVTVNGVASNGQNFTVTGVPSIINVAPNPATAGSAVTITGTGFGASPGSVTFAGVTSTPISWSDTAIDVPVPNGVSGLVNVQVIVSLEPPSNGFGITVNTPPAITGLSLPTGPVGMGFLVTGTNFGATQGNSTVTMNGVPLTVVNWSDSSITVQVTGAAASGPVVVTTADGSCTGPVFTVIPPFVCQ
jgi:hypothetical protein